MKREYPSGKYDELVGNKVPNAIKKDGKTSVTHIASDGEYWLKLKGKLKEGPDEIFGSDNVIEMTEKLAQISQTLKAIAEFAGIDERQIENARELIEARDGSFSKRIILERVD